MLPYQPSPLPALAYTASDRAEAEAFERVSPGGYNTGLVAAYQKRTRIAWKAGAAVAALARGVAA